MDCLAFNLFLGLSIGILEACVSQHSPKTWVTLG